MGVCLHILINDIKSHVDLTDASLGQGGSRHALEPV